MDSFENLLKSAKNYLDSGKFSKAIGLYQTALKKAKPEDRGKIKRDLAFCLLRGGELQAAFKEAKEAVEGFTRLGDEIELADARLLLANVLLEIGKSEDARNLSMKVYESFNGTEHHRIVGLSQRLLGRAFVQLGDYGQAKDFLRDSLSSYRRADDEGEILKSYNDLAFWGMATGNGGMALENLEKGLAIAQRSGKRREETAIVGNIGTLYRKIGKWSLASETLRAYLEKCEKLNDTLLRIHGLISLGRLMGLKRELNYSEELLNRALSLSQDYPRELAMALESLGDLAKERGNLNLAREYYQRTLDLGRELAQKDIINQVQRRRAELFLMEGQGQEASKCCEDALKVSQALGDRLEEGCCYRVQALIYEAQGNLEGARESFEKTISILESIEDKFELGRTFLEKGRFTASALKERDRGLNLLREADRLFSNMGPGCEYYRGLAKLEMAKVEPSLRSAVEHLRKAEDIFRAKGEEERLKEFEALKVEFNGKLTQPTTQKYKVLKDLASPELGEVFEGIVRELKADKGFVAYRSNEEMLIEKSHNLAREEATKVLSLLTGNNGFQPSEPVILYDTGLDDRFSSLGAGSVMIAPFASRSEGEADGYLYLARQKDKEPFLDKEYDLFYSLSPIAGRAIAEKRQRELEKRVASLERQLRLTGEIVTQDSRMLMVLEEVERLKDAGYPVLIEGETGTGKELIARLIHSSGSRKGKPFKAINCGAIPENLLESELFGHEKGSFTDARAQHKGLFESADGGTIFLDEIGDLSLSLQPKLLRFLETQTFRRVGGIEEIKVDVRVIVATNKDLAQATLEGSFREDLYYRIEGATLWLPPLRERKDDIPLLCEHFMKLFGEMYGKKVKGITPDALELLMEYDWPGNVRQLSRAIEVAVTHIKGGEGEITLDLLKVGKKATGEIEEEGVTLPEKVIQFERDIIVQALNKSNGIKTKAAQMLGIHEATLRGKIKKYNLKRVLDN